MCFINMFTNTFQNMTITASIITLYTYLTKFNSQLLVSDKQSLAQGIYKKTEYIMTITCVVTYSIVRLA